MWLVLLLEIWLNKKKTAVQKEERGSHRGPHRGRGNKQTNKIKTNLGGTGWGAPCKATVGNHDTLVKCKP